MLAKNEHSRFGESVAILRHSRANGEHEFLRAFVSQLYRRHAVLLHNVVDLVEEPFRLACEGQQSSLFH